MAKFLLTFRSSSSLSGARALPSPPDYLVECVEDAAGPAQADGLERWSVDLQIAGAVADWASGAAYDAFWAHLGSAAASLEVRPRAVLSIRAHTDGRRVGVAFDYLGDHELHRAREGLRVKLGTAVDPASKRLRGDVELRF